MSRYWNHLKESWRVLYPFPLSDGTIATIDLPDEPLSAADAKRLVAFIAALTDGNGCNRP